MSGPLTKQLTLVEEKALSIQTDCIDAFHSIGVAVSSNLKLDEIAAIIRTLKQEEGEQYSFMFDFWVPQATNFRVVRSGRESSGLPTVHYDTIDPTLGSLPAFDFSTESCFANDTIKCKRDSGVPYGALRLVPDGNSIDTSLKNEVDWGAMIQLDNLDYAEETVNPTA